MIENYVADLNFSFQNLKNNVMSLFEDDLFAKKFRLNKIIQNVSNNLSNFVTKTEHELKLKTVELSKLNPLDILALGYAKIEQNGKVLASVNEVDLKKQLEINFIDGTVSALPKE